MNTFYYEGKEFFVSDDELKNIFKNEIVVDCNNESLPRQEVLNFFAKTKPRYYLPFLNGVVGADLIILKNEGNINNFVLTYEKNKPFCFMKTQEKKEARFFRIEENKEEKKEIKEQVVEDVIKRKCETIINGSEYTFDRNLYIFYIKGNTNNFFCYSVEDMKGLIKNSLKESCVDSAKMQQAGMYSFDFIEDINNIFFNLPLPYCFLPPSFFSLLEKRYNTFELSFIKKPLTNNLSDEDKAQMENGETKMYNFAKWRKIYKQVYDVVPIVRDTLFPEFTVTQKSKIEGEQNLFSYEEDIINEKGVRIISRFHKKKFGSKDNLLPSRITYFPNSDQIQKKEWFQNGLLESNGSNPAVVVYNKYGGKEEEKWYEKNKLHSKNDEPAIINYDHDGNKKEEIWFINNVMARTENRPTKVTYFENGNIKTKEWVDEKSRYNRKNGPAFEAYYDSKENTLKEQKWIDDNIVRNLNKNDPSIILYYKDNKIFSKEWIDNTEYNHDPAIIQYYKNGDFRATMRIVNEKAEIEKFGVVSRDELYDDEEENLLLDDLDIYLYGMHVDD